jgi:hypothetical protein
MSGQEGSTLYTIEIQYRLCVDTKFNNDDDKTAYTKLLFIALTYNMKLDHAPSSCIL